jgi:hypothetical protein
MANPHIPVNKISVGIKKFPNLPAKPAILKLLSVLNIEPNRTSAFIIFSSQLFPLPPPFFNYGICLYRTRVRRQASHLLSPQPTANFFARPI